MAIAIVAVASVASACTERTGKVWDSPPPGAAKVTIDSSTAAVNATREPGVLGSVQSATVKGWTGPGNHPFDVDLRSAALEAGPSRKFGTITLPIALRNRAAAVSQYPCTSCHAGRNVTMAEKRIGDAHQNIQPVHPRQTGAACATCHAPENVALLALVDGKRASIDESYRLCGQCHFLQVDAWAGGGHGKRLDGWQGRRVVMACTDCHDPHDPAAKPRIPFRAPRIARIRSTVP
jgi:hypothetical protein